MSWRGTIRYTCLTLLVLCMGLWVLSHFFYATIKRTTSVYVVSVEVKEGRVSLYCFNHSVSDTLYRWGWSSEWHAVPLDHPFMLHLLDGDLRGFVLHRMPTTLPNWYGGIPLWCPTAMLALVSWIAWRKSRKPGRGFPVEPLDSQRGIVDG